MSELRTLTLGAGCFWCLDAVYQRTTGVTSVISGYTGGHTPNPTYREVCSGTTGHAEALRVTFDPGIVPTEVILGLFFTGHDPTSLNAQGYDVGTQYRSAMFYSDEEERAEFARAIDDAQRHFDRPIVTTLEPLGVFHDAEDVHQDFYTNYRDNGYCRVIIDPKLSRARRDFAEWVS
ncbi:peptide-methionine (S)-S-oxide reductase [Brevibacterium sanguinis]|uniref:Peptide methionine sulfoxide reductase MsrA n=2 Tax=Brevibacterium TaxID=1696 RepID=A0A366IEN0_9MICO|nr:MULTISPECIES: peptide-methionine (S)-S-oxide reductase MsrA [Brevibacterium]RBP63093.1 peptide-methionine (S)-S-oxide reductase [Brevibacterium sanguinis]RBP69731.1 peptide-methionine (S)-S-oxide reductase [Brevibacterium celere]